MLFYRLSLGRRISNGSRRSRRNVRSDPIFHSFFIRISSIIIGYYVKVNLFIGLDIVFAVQSLDSSRRSWNKKLKVTSRQPFKLRTEVSALIYLDVICFSANSYVNKKLV